MRRVTFRSVLILNLMLAAQVAFAQQREMEEYTFEIGGQLTLVNLSSLESIATTPIGTIRFQEFDRSYGGIGARFGYNFNRHLTLEAEWNHIPKTNFSEVEQSRKAQFLAGVKAGIREERFGIFAKARPGV
ncbi:MAG: hypothetical protein L0229_26515, partial [Blastocatellia bacterium]|nr:hypothetical protein [Blastocatellia bacterium]